MVSDMLSHYLALLKRSKDLTQSCNKTFLIHQVQVNFKCYNTCSNNVTKETARVNLIIGELQTLV